MKKAVNIFPVGATLSAPIGDLKIIGHRTLTDGTIMISLKPEGGSDYDISHWTLEQLEYAIRGMENVRVIHKDRGHQ